MAMAQLGETMPLDDQRRVEMKVYVVLGIAALSEVESSRVVYDGPE